MPFNSTNNWKNAFGRMINILFFNSITRHKKSKSVWLIYVEVYLEICFKRAVEKKSEDFWKEQKEIKVTSMF